MSKEAVIEVRENAKKRKNEYFVKGFDVTESVEFLLAEVEKDYEFKKQVELQCGLHSCNDILNKQAEKYRKQVADLEAKLAQAQKTIEIQKMSNDSLQEENLDYRYDITDSAYEQAKEMASNWESQYQEEIKKLKRQLAESEAYIQANVPKLIEANKMMSKQLAEKDKIIGDYSAYFNQLFNQDKISFCIEKLEKVKDEFFDIGNGWWLCFKDGTQYMTHDELEGCVRDVIDNQIRQLKEKK